MRKSINTPNENIDAMDIKAWSIDAGNIKARDIDASNINASDIDACNIKAWDIDALTITIKDGCKITCLSLKCSNRQELIDAGKVIFK